MSKNENVLDVLVIGAGPIGLACGIACTKRELSYQIVEKGCLVNAIYNYPRNMTFFSSSDKIEIGGVPFVSHNLRPTRSEALEYYRRVVNFWSLKVNTYEKVADVHTLPPDKKGPIYEVVSSKSRYLARKVIVATGFYDFPNLLNIPGENLPKVKHFYDEPHPYIGKEVLIVGAANSAIDAALECYRKGAKVTIVHRGPELSRRIKYWIKPDIENRIKEGSITAYFNANLSEIRDEEVDIVTADGPLTLDNDFVLAMTGYHPNFDWLRHIGICIAKDELQMPERDEDTFESQMPGVYLAGTVCGGMHTNRWFIENAVQHAEIIMAQIAD